MLLIADVNDRTPANGTLLAGIPNEHMISLAGVTDSCVLVTLPGHPGAHPACEG